jgi:hypothetical protein
MPVHDWTRVDAGIFHDFHLGWIGELRGALNGGLLPEGYYALGTAPPLVEQHGAAQPVSRMRAEEARGTMAVRPTGRRRQP